MAASPLRVALVTETYHPEVNGVALTLRRVVQEMLERGHHVQLIRLRQSNADTPNRGERFEEVLLRGIPIPRYRELKMGLPSARALVSLWNRQRPDIVYVATEGPLGWSALRAASRLGLPLCSDFRTNFQAYSGHYGLAWMRKPITAYLRAFHNRTAITMVPTERLRQELTSDGFERLVLVARGVDTRRFDPARRSDSLRRSWHAGPDTPVAIFVGRLAAEKNLETLAAAFAAMRAARPDVRLVVVGDGPARRELALAAPDAIFAGTRNGDDLAAHYASADMFVFPSMTETFGNVTVEAMASGLPVLAYDHAAAGELVRSGESGLLARFGDKSDFVWKAARLAAQREAAIRMGRVARQAARELGWDRIAAQLESVFAATMARTSAGGADAAAAALARAA